MKDAPEKETRTRSYTICVMDPGYGNFKFWEVNHLTGRELGQIQPSVISKVPDWEYEKLNGIGKSACVTWRGERYLAGTIALSYGMNVPSLSKGWLEELACPVFAMACVHKDVEDLYVMLSPADWDLKSRIEANLREAVPFNISFAIQGTGIWLEAKHPAKAVVIDVGFNTVDVLMVIEGAPVRELCFALKECGLVSFLEKLTKDDPVHLARRLEDGDQELAEKVRNYYFNWLFQKLEARTEWRKKPAGLKMIFGGGGAYFIPPELADKVIVPKQPELANARGFARYVAKIKRWQENAKNKPTAEEVQQA